MIELVVTYNFFVTIPKRKKIIEKRIEDLEKYFV